MKAPVGLEVVGDRQQQRDRQRRADAGQHADGRAERDADRSAHSRFCGVSATPKPCRAGRRSVHVRGPRPAAPAGSGDARAPGEGAGRHDDAEHQRRSRRRASARRLPSSRDATTKNSSGRRATKPAARSAARGRTQPGDRPAQRRGQSGVVARARRALAESASASTERARERTPGRQHDQRDRHDQRETRGPHAASIAVARPAIAITASRRPRRAGEQAAAAARRLRAGGASRRSLRRARCPVSDSPSIALVLCVDERLPNSSPVRKKSLQSFFSRRPSTPAARASSRRRRSRPSCSASSMPGGADDAAPVDELDVDALLLERRHVRRRRPRPAPVTETASARSLPALICSANSPTPDTPAVDVPAEDAAMASPPPE